MFVFPLAGAKFRPVAAQAFVLGLVTDAVLKLEREPTNHYDPNAIKVCSDDGECLGYVPRHIAAELAKLMDNATFPYHCSVRYPSKDKMPMLQVWADNEEPPKSLKEKFDAAHAEFDHSMRASLDLKDDEVPF